MAQQIKVQSSNMRPVKAGHELVEIAITETAAAASGIKTDAISLGKAYRSVKPVSAAVADNANNATYSDSAAHISIIDNSSVRIGYKCGSACTVVATLECEV